MADTRLSPVASPTPTEASMVLAVLRFLGDTPYTDTHSSTPASNYTSLTVASDATTRWEAGDYLDWVDDGTYDIALITATAATTLTVAGGQLGSTQASHSANARFRKNPRFFGINAQRAVNDALQEDLWPQVYAIYENQTTLALPTTIWYSIAATAEEVLYAYQKTSTVVDLREATIDELRDVDTTLSSTNKAFRITNAPVGLTDTLFTQYSRVPTVSDLSEGMRRIVEYGACKRLLEWEAAQGLGTDGIKPSGTQAPFTGIRTASWFGKRQEELIGKEASLLTRRYPKRKRVYMGVGHDTKTTAVL